MDCKAWEFCNAEKRCDPRAGRCNFDTDCGVGQYCNTKSHTCEVPSNI